MFYGVDLMYFVFTLPALLLGMWAQYMVKHRIKQMHEMQNQLGLTGRDTAQRILDANGITNVRIEGASGWLSDHYSPSEKVVRLSPEVHDGRTVSALAIAAHEIGHAIQDHRAYPALVLRSTLAPAAAFGSNLAMILIPIGFMLNWLGLVKIALILFAVMVLFTLITLPVEFDASRRALKQLEVLQLTGGPEYVAARKVLTACAMTYVAAAVAAMLQFLYFAWRAGLLGNRRH
jgi:Zn-dependent membrane protease YugP